MSIYAYIVCHDTKQQVWLGKVLHDNREPYAFCTGSGENWKQEKLNKVIWNFLAENANRDVSVLTEDKMTEEIYGYVTIGGDGPDDMTYEDFLNHPSGIYSK